MASLPRTLTKAGVAVVKSGSKGKAAAIKHGKAPETMGAAAAKAQLLRLLDVVERERKVIPITKRGRVVAHLVPAPEEKRISNFDRIFGESRGLIKTTGDIVSADWESWGPEWR